MNEQELFEKQEKELVKSFVKPKKIRTSIYIKKDVYKKWQELRKKKVSINAMIEHSINTTYRILIGDK